MRKINSPVTIRTRKGKKGESIYLDIYVNGERSYEYLNLYLSGGNTPSEKAEDKKKMEIALEIKRKREEDIAAKKFGVKNDIDFLTFFESNVTTKSYNSVYVALKKYLKKPINISMIDTEFINKFYSHLKETRKINSCNTYISILKSMISKAEKQGYKTKKIFFQKPASKPAVKEHLSIDEIKYLYSIFYNKKDEVLMRCFLFSCLTGLRISDASKIIWSDIRLEYGNYRLYFRQKKTRNDEYLDLNKQAVDLLGERGDEDSLIFKIKGYNHINDNLRKKLEEFGINRHITYHCSRHTFAIMMLELDTDLYTVSKLLGHTNINTTQIYAKVVDKKKRDAMNKIPKLL